jgi:C4-dicarboxylate-specific signal transduction histidine kinase
MLQIKTDEKLFKEMLSSLIDNAIDALEEETDEIIVRIVSAHEITVTNSGLPIKAKEVRKIFHPFFTTKAQSLGLGLSRAALIAESMGMYLYLKMNNKQDGVVFSIELIN